MTGGSESRMCLKKKTSAITSTAAAPKRVAKSAAVQINIVGVFIKNNKAVAIAIQINPMIRNFFSPILSESLPKVYGKNTKGVSITVKIIPMVGQDKHIC